jgi:hypothetical protein
MLAPYSISTGVEGEEELSGCLRSLRLQGFCVVDRAIPAAELSAVRDDVIAGQSTVRQRRGTGLPPGLPEEPEAMSWYGEPAVERRPAPPPEWSDIVFAPRFWCHAASPRVMAIAAAALDTHLRVARRAANSLRGGGGAPLVGLTSSSASDQFLIEFPRDRRGVTHRRPPLPLSG